MNGWIVSLDLLVIGLTLCNATEEWTADIYPSPQDDPGKCGRSSKSFVCDPDRILTGDEANELDLLIEEVFAGTKAPCSNHGYRIGVALVAKIKDKDGSMNASMSTNAIQARQMLDRLNRMREFATDVRKAWHLGACDDDVLIVFSMQQNVVYTTRGAAAEQKLNDAVIYEITQNASQTFRNGDTFLGLKKIIKDYRAVFDGTYVPVPMATHGPVVDYIIDAGNAARTLQATGVSSLMVAIVTAVLVTIATVSH